jgi:SAM-dependent methyltransferase
MRGRFQGVGVTVFRRYADCYDLVYQDKDYAQEVAFACDLIHGFLAGANDLLELGCGTAGHAVLLAERGYRVTGVDRSAEMLAKAAQRLAQQPASVAEKVSLVEGDIPTAELGQRFDAALAFFHVVSYLTEDDVLAASFRNVLRHLKSGGLLLFDYWHGPAVEAQKPERRVRTFENADQVVHRIMQPTWIAERHCVRIDIALTVTDKETGRAQNIEEQHLMRYFEPDELRRLLETVGFVVHRTSAWLSDDPPGESTWGACILAARA